MSCCDWLHRFVIGGCLGVLFVATISDVRCEPKGAQKERPATTQAEITSEQFFRGLKKSDEQQQADYYKSLCDYPQSNEQRGLCQQWRVANATAYGVKWTAKSVKWMERQYYATWVEIGALILTVFAALWAALAATSAVSVARDTAKRELRAYIAVNIIPVDGPYGKFKLGLNNVGQTLAKKSALVPAYSVQGLFLKALKCTIGRYFQKSPLTIETLPKSLFSRLKITSFGRNLKTNRWKSARPNLSGPAY